MLEQTLATLNSVLGVLGLGGIAGIGIAIWRLSSAVTNARRDIHEAKVQVQKLEDTVQKDGLAKEIKTMQINCAGQMASLTTALKDHLQKDT